MQIYLKAFKLLQLFVILCFISQLIVKVQLLLNVGLINVLTFERGPHFSGGYESLGCSF